MVAFGIYGVVERALVRLACTTSGMSPSRCKWGNLPTPPVKSFMAIFHAIAVWRPYREQAIRGFLFKMYGLLDADIVIWHAAQPGNQARVGYDDFRRADAFLTGITEPIEFSFMSVAPLSMSFSHIGRDGVFAGILLGMLDGTSFSHGLIDCVVLCDNSGRI